MTTAPSWAYHPPTVVGAQVNWRICTIGVFLVACKREPAEDTTPVESEPAGPGLADLVPGDLLISEFHQDPVNCDDADGEYIEVLYRGDLDVDLSGITLTANEDHHTFLDSIEVQPGDRLVFGRNGFEDCYGTTPDLHMDLQLSNSGKLLGITDGDSVTFDLVDTSEQAVKAGASRERSDDDPETWCDAAPTDVLPNGDLGTPGEANDTCPPVQDNPYAGVYEGVLDATLLPNIGAPEDCTGGGTVRIEPGDTIVMSTDAEWNAQCEYVLAPPIPPFMPFPTFASILFRQEGIVNELPSASGTFESGEYSAQWIGDLSETDGSWHLRGEFSGQVAEGTITGTFDYTLKADE